MFSNEEGITVHLLAADYDVDIDHKLDEMRFHRSRVNYVNKVEPRGVTCEIRVEADRAPIAYVPFGPAASVKEENGVFSVTLPEKSSYVLLHFPNKA